MTTKINYDLNIYSIAAINQAIKDYIPILFIDKQLHSSHVVQLSFHGTAGIETIVGEFNNYLIQIENNLGVK
ncbi:MAG: hypothetical protein RR131_07250 [Anaerovorax sp.]